MWLPYKVLHSPPTPRLTLSTHHAYEHPATARVTLQRMFRGHKAPSFQRSISPTFLGSLETQVSYVSKNQCILYLYARKLLTISPSFSCVTIVQSFNFFSSSAVFAGLLPTLYSPDVLKNDFRVNICSHGIVEWNLSCVPNDLSERDAQLNPFTHESDQYCITQ